MSSERIDEKDIIAACKRNLPWAQKMLYERYAPAMLSLCVRYVTDRETARDILQDGFVKLFSKIDTYAATGSFGGWARRIFVTTALEHLRNNEALKWHVSLDEYDLRIKDTDNTLLEKLSADELLECIAALPGGYRTVFNLYAIEGYSHAEIATILHIKESTSRSQFARARQVLQQTVLEKTEVTKKQK